MTRSEADWAALWEETTLDVDAPAKEAATPRWRRQEDFVRRELGSFDGLEVIEIGSGRGLNALLFAQRGARATLLDTEQIALDQAAELFTANGVDFTPVIADAFRLPEELQGRFDVAMSYGLCEHFVGDERQRMIASHLQLVRPGGIAMIGVPNRLAPAYRLWRATMMRRGTWIFGTEEPFTAAELARRARAAGGEPLPPIYGSFTASLVGHGANQLLYKLGRGGLPLPQLRVPVLDRFAYELVVPFRRIT